MSSVKQTLNFDQDSNREDSKYFEEQKVGNMKEGDLSGVYSKTEELKVSNYQVYATANSITTLSQ